MRSTGHILVIVICNSQLLVYMGTKLKSIQPRAYRLFPIGLQESDRVFIHHKPVTRVNTPWKPTWKPSNYEVGSIQSHWGTKVGV